MSAETNNSNPSRKPNLFLWVGFFLVLFGFLSYFFYFVFLSDFRDFPWANLPLLILGLALLGMAVWRSFARPKVYRGRILGSIFLLLSVGITSLFYYYIFHLSYQVPPPSEVTQNLETAPDIALVDHEGNKVRLKDYHGKHVVLSFYRGYW